MSYYFFKQINNKLNRQLIKLILFDNFQYICIFQNTKSWFSNPLENQEINSALFSTNIYYSCIYVQLKITTFIILYTGNNQHKGTTSKPREFAIDDLIIPQPDSEEHYRVQVKNL